MPFTLPPRARHAGTPTVPRPGDAARSRQRHARVALGVLWIVDGALQLQPSMFGRRFVTGVLVPSLAGSPRFVAGPVLSVAHWLEPHVAAWNALFASVQLLIGVGLLVRRTVRPALALSVVWSLAVWWLGEGLGGLFSGSASPLTGAPGAVLLYALAALLVWPRRAAAQPAPSGSAAANGLLGDRGSRLAWAVLWLGGAALLCQPANLSADALRATVAGAAAGEPRWLSDVLLRAASAVGGSATGMVAALAVAMAAVGVGVALRWGETWLLGLAVVLAVLVWVFGEALGGILTGTGTDPNTGPLLVLLGLALHPVGERRRAVDAVPMLSGVGA